MNTHFQVGFVKAAIDNGFTPLQAVELLKKADPWAEQMINSGIIGANSGLALGGIVGGAGQLLKPKKDRHYLEGTLGGAGIGALAGGGIGAARSAANSLTGGSINDLLRDAIMNQARMFR